MSLKIFLSACIVFTGCASPSKAGDNLDGWHSYSNPCGSSGVQVLAVEGGSVYKGLLVIACKDTGPIYVRRVNTGD